MNLTWFDTGAASNAPPGSPSPARGRGGGGVRALRRLALEVECHRPGDGRGLAIRAAVFTSRDVAEVVLEHSDAAHGRRKADHAHRVHLVGGDGPDFLAQLDLLLLGHPE